MSKPSCTASTRQQQRCRQFALPGESYCWTHHPDHAAEYRAASAKGGKVKALHGKRLKLDSPRALMRFLSGVIYDTLDGTLEPGTARTLAYAVATQHRLVETSELEQRIAALEAAQQYRKGMRTWPPH